MPPLRLGKIPTGLGTATLFVTISEDDRPLLRVDLYDGLSSSPFTDAVGWGERVFVGFEDALYVIDPKARVGSSISLASYFQAFYATADLLVVASGRELLRLSRSGEILWRAPDLAVDGVIVRSVDKGLIHGEGEWDPPGGWRAFVLRLDSGERVS